MARAVTASVVGRMRQGGGEECAGGVRGVAACGHGGRDVAVDGVTDEVVEDVAEEEPREDEEAEHAIADALEAAVFEHFGRLKVLLAGSS